MAYTTVAAVKKILQGDESDTSPDAAAYFDAWIVRRRRDPVGAEAFWVEANRFLDAYAKAEAETYVGSA